MPVLEVTFADGTTAQYPISASATVTVTESSLEPGSIGSAFSFAFSGATDVKLLPDAPTVDAPVLVTEPVPAPAPIVDTPAEQQDATLDTAPPTGEAPLDPADVAAHTDAVNAATDAAVNATLADKRDAKAIIVQALADVDIALAQWPDSTELQDAKAQLDQLTK